MRKAGGRRRHLFRRQQGAAGARHPKPSRTRKRPAVLEAGVLREPLQDLYGETRLVMMAVDPYLVHAYWEVTDADLQKARACLGREGGEPRPVLRFHDVTNIDFNGSNAHCSFDVEVDLRPRNWYVRLWSADKTYCVDLGLAAAGGRFVPLVRSNTLRVPRAEPSSSLEAHFWRPGESAADPALEQEHVSLAALQHPTGHSSGQEAGPEGLPGVERKVPMCAVEPRSPAAPDDSPLAAVFATVASPVPDDPRDLTEEPEAGQDLPDGRTVARDLTLECERQFLPGLSS